MPESFIVKCPSCSKNHTLDDGPHGTEIRCPSCDQPVAVPPNPYANTPVSTELGGQVANAVMDELKKTKQWVRFASFGLVIGSIGTLLGAGLVLYPLVSSGYRLKETAYSLFLFLVPVSVYYFGVKKLKGTAAKISQGIALVLFLFLYLRQNGYGFRGLIMPLVTAGAVLVATRFMFGFWRAIGRYEDAETEADLLVALRSERKVWTAYATLASIGVAVLLLQVIAFIQYGKVMPVIP